MLTTTATFLPLSVLIAARPVWATSRTTFPRLSRRPRRLRVLMVPMVPHTGSRYLEKPEELAEYRRIFTQIEARSVPIEEFSGDFPRVEKVKQVRRQRR